MCNGPCQAVLYSSEPREKGDVRDKKTEVRPREVKCLAKSQITTEHRQDLNSGQPDCKAPAFLLQSSAV